MKPVARPASRNARLMISGLLAIAVAAAIIVPGASAATTSVGNGAADAPVAANLEGRFITASEIFVNCADAIEITKGSGEAENSAAGPGYNCEYRVAIGSDVVKGQDEVVSDPNQPGSYLLASTSSEGKAPSGPRNCVVGHPILAHKAILRGSACGHIADLPIDEIEERAFGSGFHGEPVPKRLPAHFVVGDSGEDEVGFVVNRFQCQGHTRSLGKARVPWTATCVTQFGDGIMVSFGPYHP